MTRKMLLVLTAASLSSAPAFAATFDLQTTVGGTFDAGFNPIVTDLSQAQPGPVIVQVDFVFTISDFGANERNFANTAFNIALGAGLTAQDFGGGPYNPDTSSFDANGAAPGGITQIWSTNLDAGVPGDLQGILASIAGGLGASDVRSNLGETSPQLIGSIFLEWDGATTTSISTSNVQFSTVTVDTGLFGTPSTAPGSTLVLGANIPEPGSLALLGLGGLLIARRRRSA